MKLDVQEIYLEKHMRDKWGGSINRQKKPSDIEIGLTPVKKEAENSDDGAVLKLFRSEWWGVPSQSCP